MLVVLWRSFFDLGVEFSLVMLVGGMALIFLFFIFKYSFQRPSLVFAATALFCVAAALGMLRFDLMEVRSNPNVLDEYIGEKVQLTGVVSESVEKDLDNARIALEVTEVEEQKLSKSTGVVVFAGPYVDISYGDKLELSARLEEPENFGGEHGGEFNYISYLAKDGIYYQIFSPDYIKKISEDNGNPVKQTLLNIKNSFLDKIRELIPSPESDLLGGLLLGAKGPLGDELQQKFRETGIMHIVVLSGYNVSVVAEGVMGVLSGVFVPLISSIIGGGAIIAFAIITGASATVIRASIMALLVILARMTGRTYMVMRALLLAGALMVLYNPMTLAFDPSFQLSFVATFGLIVLSPYFNKVFTFIPNKLQLKEVVIATLSTQLFVMPIILYMMGELSIVSVPVNLLILITIPAVMLLGFITGVLGFISSLLTLPLAWGSYLILAYQLKVVEFFSSFEFAALKVESFPFWALVLLYMIYALIIWKIYRAQPGVNINEDSIVK